MKKSAFCLLFLLCSGWLLAQKNDLVVKKSDNGLYLEHKVAPRESFFAVGRLYNVSPKYLAAFNKLDINKGLLIDQKLRIPLTDTNFTQQGNSGTPVYYKSGDKEDLADVAAKLNNVPPVNLQGWNNLAGTDLKEGTKLIIGFLRSREFPSITITPKTVKPEEPVVKTEKPEVKEVVQPVETKPVETKPAEQPAEKEVTKPIEEKVETKPIEEKVEEKPVLSDQGYFKTHFEKQTRINPVTKNETVASGIFKTLSGWQDGKYYLLVDKIPAGTIVKVINPTNNKSVYAKVLGEMSGIRQNQGLDIRISNAAASVLEISEQDKFIVKVSY